MFPKNCSKDGELKTFEVDRSCLLGATWSWYLMNLWRWWKKRISNHHVFTGEIENNKLAKIIGDFNLQLTEKWFRDWNLYANRVPVDARKMFARSPCHRKEPTNNPQLIKCKAYCHIRNVPNFLQANTKQNSGEDLLLIKACEITRSATFWRSSS